MSDNAASQAAPPEATMTRRRLPIGIQTFREIREDGCYYVDKTAHIRRLLDEGKHYFLSRPRRFGKSLFLDTCKELFEGSEALFEGLAIHDSWDWSVRNPVVLLSFGAGHFKRPDDLRAGVTDRLEMQESQAGITARHESAPARLAHLIRTLHERTGQRVAVLVDEYDKPILDALDVPEVARANRDYLRGLYSVIKDSDAHIRFSFITGVSKFSKVSLFSGLNNLTDITLDPRYSTICGYTDADLDTVFAPELAGLNREKVREWYNGYGWRGDERVYNPFDILLLFRNREFGAWWFETGTPVFLVETLFRRRVSALALDGMLGSAELLSTFDVDDMPTEALLFQTGYLTIVRAEPRGAEMFYRLGYPNLEVRQSLNRSLLNHMTGDPSRRASNSARLYDLLLANDFDGLKALFHSFYASIPAPVVHQQRHRALRGLLRERVLLVLRRPRARHHGRGQHQPRAARHGGALQRQRVSLRAQGGGDGGRGSGHGAVEGAALRGQVPGCGRADSPRGGGVQPGCAQRGGVRGRGGLNGGVSPVLALIYRAVRRPSIRRCSSRTRASFRRVWCGSTRSNPHSRHTEYSMSLTENSCPLYWYVSFEYPGSHGAGVRQMGQSWRFRSLSDVLGNPSASAADKQPKAEMASVPHGKRTIQRNRKRDFEQRTRRVELLFASPRPETMEMECVASGAPDVDGRQLPNVPTLSTSNPSLRSIPTLLTSRRNSPA